MGFNATATTLTRISSSSMAGVGISTTATLRGSWITNAFMVSGIDVDMVVGMMVLNMAVMRLEGSASEELKVNFSLSNRAEYNLLIYTSTLLGLLVEINSKINKESSSFLLQWP